jgi:Tfp pilus assembly protein FimT
MAELLIVISMAGIVAMMAGSPLRRGRDTYSVRAARQTITATLDAARSGAIQRGRTGRFVVRGNAVVAYVDTAATAGGPVSGQFTVLAPQDFFAAYGVKLSVATAADTLVAYDGRGFANPRLGRVARVIITKGTARDSVCVTNLGQVLPRGCAL